MNKTPVTPQTDYPKSNIPYRVINHPFRFSFIVPGKGITIEKDPNGILYISSESGMDVADLVAGDNIELTRTEDGKIIVSAVNTVADVSAGQNVSIDIDPETGSAVINVDTGGDTSEHYKGVFDTAQDLIDYDSDPEIGDYGLIKNLTFTDGGDVSWSGQYKYCFFINGMWTVVDQMLTFTNNTDLIQQFFSVGGSSPVIYLHEVARTGDFNSLKNVPIVATPEVTVEGTTITVTCATEGADIYYTTDGTMPHVTATKYTGPLTATGPTNYRFVAVKNGMINSLEALASADYDLQEPVFNLDYTTGAITIENPNLDGNNDPVGAIYYTTDGSTPTDQSTPYTDPIMAPDVPSYTIKAIVIDSGNNLESDVATKTYPRIGAGSFGRSTNWITNVIYLTLRASNNATIHYSTDGSTPSYQSPGGATAVVSTQIYVQKTVKYRSFCEGYLPSSVMSYTIGYAKPSAPSIVFDSETNTVTINRTGETLSINTSNDNKICYTTDGSTPTAQSAQYTGPFPVTNGMTVKAIFVAYGEYLSDVSALEVTILKMPSFIFDSNTGTLTLTDLNTGGVIYYTTDGSTPTAGSTQYVSPIVLTEETVVKCISVVENVGQSRVCILPFDQAVMPNIKEINLNISTGDYQIVIENPNGKGKIHYTTDGSTPTYQSPVYSTPVSRNIFDGELTVKAIVVMTSDTVPSQVATLVSGNASVTAPEITVDDDTNEVTIELGGNTADIPLQTNNNVPSMGARIYYTTDGSTPTTASMLYTGPFALPEGVTTIKAITVCYGEFNSDVTTEEVGPAPVTSDYMYFEAAEANSTVSLTSMLETAPNLEYSTDGETWHEWQHITAEGTHTFDTLTLTAVGDRLYLRGDNPNGLAIGGLSDAPEQVTLFSLSGLINSGGRIISLIDKNLEATELPDYAFPMMLANTGGSATLLSPPSFEGVTSCGKLACAYMLMGQTLLGTAIDFPDLISMGKNAFMVMYMNCTFDMSDDGSTLNFDFPSPPVTAGETTYATAYDVAQWMGNTNGFTTP